MTVLQPNQCTTGRGRGRLCVPITRTECQGAQNVSVCSDILHERAGAVPLELRRSSLPAMLCRINRTRRGEQKNWGKLLCHCDSFVLSVRRLVQMAHATIVKDWLKPLKLGFFVLLLRSFCRVFNSDVSRTKNQKLFQKLGATIGAQRKLVGPFSFVHKISLSSLQWGSIFGVKCQALKLRHST